MTLILLFNSELNVLYVDIVSSYLIVYIYISNIVVFLPADLCSPNIGFFFFQAEDGIRDDVCSSDLRK